MKSCFNSIVKSIAGKLCCAALLAGMIVTSNSAASAQEDKGGLVAVLDVAQVFKMNQNFDSKMAAIKSEADTLKTQIEQQMEAIQNEAQSLGQYAVGSSERNQMEASLEQKQTSLRTKARQAEADLLNREAKIYFDTYQQMQTVVASLADQHGISLVIRFDSEKIDSENRAEVIKGVNRAVVFHRRIDLTNMVIQNMGPTTTAAAPTGTQNK